MTPTSVLNTSPVVLRRIAHQAQVAPGGVALMTEDGFLFRRDSRPSYSWWRESAPLTGGSNRPTAVLRTLLYRAAQQVPELASAKPVLEVTVTATHMTVELSMLSPLTR